jgi:hypothetical protein
MWPHARTLAVASSFIVAALFSVLLLCQTVVCFLVYFFIVNFVSAPSVWASQSRGHCSLGGLLGLAESGAELPAVSQSSGALSVFGSLFIALRWHTPRQVLHALAMLGIAASHDACLALFFTSISSALLHI